MAILYLYIQTFWPNFWLLLPTGALFGLKELAKKWLPPVSRWLDMIPEAIRTRIELAVFILVVFYSGFSAWDTEHEKLIQSQGRLLELAGSRAPRQYLRPIDIDRLNKVFCPAAVKVQPILVGSIWEDPQAIKLARQFLGVLVKCGVGLVGRTDFPRQVVSDDPSETGILVSVSDPNDPDEKSKALMQGLLDAGIDAQYSTRIGPPPTSAPMIWISRQ